MSNGSAGSLLKSMTRVGRDSLELSSGRHGGRTHRPSVTVVAQALQDAGLISYRRGAIEVLDRKGLEKTSCECYAVVRREFERLLGNA